MYVAVVPNRKSPPAILVREGYREDGKVKTRTLANLTRLPTEAINAIRLVFKGKKLVPSDELFEIVPDGSKAHGHVEAVLTAMKKLGFAKLICSRSYRERDLACAMIAARIINPQSKLATSRSWSNTTLSDMLDIGEPDETELYDAMDWLLERQPEIEKKLASRHLEENGMALYDLTSSYYEGEKCPLIEFGHNRDEKKGKKQINYGLLTNNRGTPVSVSVFKGNVSDSKTLIPKIETVKNNFGINRFVIVGDRGMITQKQVNNIKEIEGIDWLTALRPESIRKLLESGSIQMELFDEIGLYEIEHPDWPDERLIACRNPELSESRRNKREALLDATAQKLEKISKMVARGRLYGKDAISEKLEKILESCPVKKYYRLEVFDTGFDYTVDEKQLESDVTKAFGTDSKASTRMKAYKRSIEAVNRKLDKVRKKTEQGRLRGKDIIGVKVGKVINQYKVGKHFLLHIEDNSFTFEIDTKKVKAEAALDGIYVIRTSADKGILNTQQAVLGYKLLSNVEQAFRSLKSIDLMVRPIRHSLEKRVKSHILICMLAYYVQWHMIEAWRPLLFVDEDQEAKASRHPVAPSERSASAMKKVQSKKLEDGSPVHSFRTLLDHLGEIVRNTCLCPDTGQETVTFQKTTTPNAKQQKALNLIENISLQAARIHSEKVYYTETTRELYRFLKRTSD